MTQGYKWGGLGSTVLHFNPEGLFYCLIFSQITKGKRALHIYLLIFQEKGKEVYTDLMIFHPRNMGSTLFPVSN